VPIDRENAVRLVLRSCATMTSPDCTGTNRDRAVNLDLAANLGIRVRASSMSPWGRSALVDVRAGRVQTRRSQTSYPSAAHKKVPSASIGLAALGRRIDAGWPRSRIRTRFQRVCHLGRDHIGMSGRRWSGGFAIGRMAHEVSASGIEHLLSMCFGTGRGIGRNFVRCLRNAVLLQGVADYHQQYQRSETKAAFQDDPEGASGPMGHAPN
jgi:hypothetical protein